VSAKRRLIRTPRPALRAKRQEEILDAAAKLFAKHGFAETDTQLLADNLGVGKGTLYRYFPSKEDLFLAATDRVMSKLRAEIDNGIAAIVDPLDQVKTAVRICLAFYAEHPEFVELLMQERAQFKDRKKPTYFEHRETHVERWKAFYRSLIADGRIRNIPVERITDVMTHLIYGTMFTNYFIGRREPPEKQARDILDVVFNGILSDSERRRLGVAKRNERKAFIPGRRHPVNRGVNDAPR
jgi:AcrR family transcriptional regulator